LFGLRQLQPRRLPQHHRTAKMGAIDDGFEALLEPFYNGKSLTDPISTKEDKYQLLPAFLKVKGESLRH
jgi:DNA-directed RNA polymerase III subunit RPC2